MLTLRMFVMSSLLILTGCVAYPYQPAGYAYGGSPYGYGQSYAPAYMAPPVNVVVPLAVPGPWYRPYNRSHGRPYGRPHHRD
jgi:hypothetical protein